MPVLHPSSMFMLSVGLLVSLTTSVRHEAEEGRNTIDENALSTKKVKTGKGGADVLGQDPHDYGDVGEIEYTNRKEEASIASFDNSVANDKKKPSSLSQHAIATEESRGATKTGKGGADVLGQEPTAGPDDFGEIEYTNRKDSVANDTKKSSSLSQHAIATEESHGGHNVAVGSNDVLKKVGLTDANIDALMGGKCLTDGPSAGLGCNFPGGCDCEWYRSCNKGDSDSFATKASCLLTPTTDACMTTLVGKCQIAIWVWIGAAALILILIGLCVFYGMKKKPTTVQEVPIQVHVHRH